MITGPLSDPTTSGASPSGRPSFPVGEPLCPVDTFEKIRDLVGVAETYDADGAPETAKHRLVEARALIDALLQPVATPEVKVSLEQLVETVESARRRRPPEEIAAVPWVAEAIAMHDTVVAAKAEVAELARRQHAAALVAWINNPPECTCVVTCADDPKSACTYSGQRHVHPLYHGQYGPCPHHPDAVGDL